MGFTKVILSGSKDKIKVAFGRFNTLIDDLLAVTSGKGASQIGILDSALNMDATNVEDALAEIYTDTTTTRLLAELFEVDSSTTVGLTWGYKAGSVRFDNAITAVAAGVVSLTDDTTNYVEVNSSGVVSKNTTGFTSGRVPIRQIVTASGVQTSSLDKRSWFQSWDMPLPVAKGGTGAVTLTDGGILLGSGTGAITALGVATNGQIPIGDGTTDPVLAAPTGTANQVTVTLGAGTIGLSLPTALIPPGTVDPVGVVTIINTGLHILDTNASHDLIIKPGSDLTADKTLTITTGDSDRTLTLSADMTLTGYASAAEIITGTEVAKAIAPDQLAASYKTVPVGTIIGWATGTPPAGYLECDGSTISKTTYANLYSVIGYTYGGSADNMVIPDYRGRFLRGWAHGQTTDPDKATRTDRGDGTGGDNVGSKQADEQEAHTHGNSGAHTHTVTTYNAGGTGGASEGSTSGASSFNTGSTAHEHSSVGGNETRPININVLYCIKY